MDKYQKAVKVANAKAELKFQCFGPYKVGTVEHEYWLKVFDEEMIGLINND